MIESVECKLIFSSFIRFILTDKTSTVEKIKGNCKKLIVDLENQKEMKKKLEDTLSSQTTQYNEILKRKV